MKTYPDLYFNEVEDIHETDHRITKAQPQMVKDIGFSLEPLDEEEITNNAFSFSAFIIINIEDALGKPGRMNKTI